MAQKKPEHFEGLGNLEKSARNRFAVQESIAALRDGFDEIIEYQKLIAQLKYHRFKTLTDAGFTEEQALKLCASSDIL